MSRPSRPEIGSRSPVLAAAVAVVAALAAAPGCPRAPAGPPPAVAPAVLVPPLHDAAAGEELRLRRGTEDYVWRVVSTTDEEVEVESTVFRDGVVSQPPVRIRFDRNGWGIPRDPHHVIREIRRDHVEAGGRGWDCWMLRVHSRTSVRYYWITDELPVHGVVRIAIDDRGKPVLPSAVDVVPDACAFPR
jgi:hypothetical protein